MVRGLLSLSCPALLGFKAAHMLGVRGGHWSLVTGFWS